MFPQPAGRAGNHREGTAMSKTANAPTTIAELKAEARTKWNRWAVQLADTGVMPAPRDLLDSGIVLGFESPADALERDAKIIATVRERQAAIDVANAATAAWVEQTGGHDVLQRLHDDLREQLEKLDALMRGNQHNVQLRSVNERELSALRRQYPELLGGL
jgi:hypothetical protein